MSTQVAPLGLRLFLEGVEVPVIAAQVVIQPSQPAVASIQIVPTDSALLLLPRTYVSLYYLDSELTAEDRRISDTIDQTKIDRFDVEDERYRLMFCGEVTGLNYQKTPSSRSVVLQCMDLSTYWDTCYQWFADYSVGGDGFTDKMHYFVGAGEGLFDNIASGTRWVIGNILTSAPANPEYKNVKGLLAGFIHLLESIGGLRPGRKADGTAASYQAYRGVNDFFTIAELRYNLTGMVGAVAKDTTSYQMYAAKAFLNWLQQGMASAGSLVSYRDVLRLVGQYIFHDVYPNPVARYVKGQDGIRQTQTRTYSESSVGSEVTRLLNLVVSDMTTVRSTLSSLQGDGGISFADGRSMFASAIANMSSAVDQLRNSASDDRARVGTQLQLAKDQIEGAFTQFASSAVADTTASTDAVSPSVASGIATALDGPISVLENVLGARVTRTSTKQVEVSTGDHLFNQLILPETYFVVPPRCNVIFPDQYTHLSYNRNFMREVSRLMLQGGMGILSMGQRGDGILTSHYFAPNIRDARGKVINRTVFGSTTLLPHEVHSGIIPKVEWVSEGHRWGVKAAATQGKTLEERKKVSYIQRLANFQFFLHRFASRSMSCVMRFNPMLVLGFPAVVIDRATPSAAAIQAMSTTLDTGTSFLPTAYIGKVANITHDVSQDGGQTQVAFTHARTHRGFDDEFLGVLARERKDLSTREYEVDVAEFFEARSSGSSIDDLDTRIVVKYISNTLIVGSQLGTEKLIRVVPNPESLTVTYDQLLQLNISQEVISARFFSQVDGPSGGVSGQVQVPRTITVTLESKTNLGKFVTPSGAFPPEILLQPGWYSPVWSPENISTDVYEPLLGCSAITDDQAIGDAQGFLDLVNQFMNINTTANERVEAVRDGESVTLQYQGQAISSFNLATGTLEQSIDGLTALYGILKSRGLDVQTFINDYTRRPVATLVDVLGTSNLEFTDAGAVLDPATMVEGFHSRAFGDYNADVRYRNPSEDEAADPVAGQRAFVGLIPPGAEATFNKSVIDKGRNLPAIPKFLDPRGRARQRVLAYASELSVSRGLSA
jgi:hypothetical protein